MSSRGQDLNHPLKIGCIQVLFDYGLDMEQFLSVRLVCLLFFTRAF